MLQINGESAETSAQRGGGPLGTGHERPIRARPHVYVVGVQVLRLGRAMDVTTDAVQRMVMAWQVLKG
jgi:hypothetical protein